MKKVATYVLIAFGIICFGAILWFCEFLYRQEEGKFVCNSIEVKILDSTANKLVTPATVCEMISRIENPIGIPVRDINLNVIENGLTGMGAIFKTDVAVDKTGRMIVEIIQRHPVLRYQSDTKGYYIDDTGFCVPLSDLFTSDVPIVTGFIREDNNWKYGLVELGDAIDRDDFWHTQVEQIDILPDGSLKLFLRSSEQTILFGQPDNIDSKLSRLFTYYKNIAPVYGSDYYSDIDLRFSRQIVCTKSANRKQSDSLWVNTSQQ